MESELKLEFKFSKELNEDMEQEIQGIIDEITNKLKKDDSKISLKIDSKKDELSLIIQSSNVNLTDLVVQADRRIKEHMGKNYKIGLKKYHIPSYKLTFEIEKEAQEPVVIPFLEDMKIEGKTVTIKYKDLEKEFIENHNVERTVNLIKEKIDRQYYEGKTEHHEILYESPARKIVYDKDPTEEMLKSNWLKSGPTKGKWHYGPQITAVLRAMEKIAVEEILKPLGFMEIMNSNIVAGEDIWMKTGHLEGMPMEIYYVMEPVTRDVATWQPFIDELKVTKKVPYHLLKDLIEMKPLKGLCYAQCPIIYWAFKGKTLAEETLPLMVYDNRQNSFRYESGGRHGIERVDEFYRIEPVYIGHPDQMVALKDKLFARYQKVFDEILELEWRTAWVTPFYMQQAGEFKQDEKEKTKGTIDFEAYLPYRGDKDKVEWLEFQNLSIVGDKYTQAFNIKSQKDELWSGCTGIGLQRWTIAFLAQKGLDPNKWPKKFKDYVGELPKEIKFV